MIIPNSWTEPEDTNTRIESDGANKRTRYDDQKIVVEILSLAAGQKN